MITEELCNFKLDNEETEICKDALHLSSSEREIAAKKSD